MWRSLSRKNYNQIGDWMSENKRFNYVLGDGFTDYMMPLSATEVCGLLNELHEENNELKSDLKELKEIGGIMKRIYFEWYGINKDNSESFGQITFADYEGNKVGVVNLDLKYQDIFLLIFEVFKKYGDKDIEMIYDVVIEW